MMLVNTVNSIIKHYQPKFRVYAASERGQKKNQLFYWGNDLLAKQINICNTWASAIQMRSVPKMGLNTHLQLVILEQTFRNL